MIKQLNHQDEEVVRSDPMLLLTKLLIKIDQREKVIENLQEVEEDESESNQRSTDSANQGE